MKLPGGTVPHLATLSGKGHIVNSYRLLAVACSAVALLGLSACAGSQSGSAYTRSQTRGEMLVRMGVVESVRTVTIEGTQSGVGAIAGGVLGGIAGSNVGQGSGSTAGAVVGAVLGGLAGQAIEEQGSKKSGLEITIRLDSGQIIAVTQEADEAFNPGERVRILSGDGVTRVSH
jgi:outer membrane lipoprotein SlyB